MALPINIEDLLNRKRIESNRVEFKRGWNPRDIYHTICAFANDFDNLGGGYILVGIEQDENGRAVRPVHGVPTEDLDKIEKEMVGYNNKFTPYYMPRTYVEEIDGRNIFVIWVPAGERRPYYIRTDVTSKSNPQEAPYVRSGTSSIVAKGEVLDELRDMANRTPFDCRGNASISEDDIDLILLRDYLQKVKSRMVGELKNMGTMDVLERMDLLTGPSEQRIIKNVAAMMFCNHPEKFFPKTQISVVNFPEGRINNPNRFSEKTFKGSVPSILRGALQYIKDVIITEYVQKPKDRPESDRWFNYPYQAIEEGVVNAMYHRDYQEYQEVEITFEPEGAYILSFSGPDRSITDKALKDCQTLHSRRYRNSRLGDFLKELELTEGRSTGIPTIQDELRKNGSPRATIETNEERSYFLMFIPIHADCEPVGTFFQTNSGIEHSSESQNSPSSHQAFTKLSPSSHQVQNGYSPSSQFSRELIQGMNGEYYKISELAESFGYKDTRYFRRTYIVPALKDGTLEYLYPNSPTHPNQKYRLTFEALNWKTTNE